ncbi:uncharacterized protein [Leptinotarsa decemlineata]|uniref:uncharacterized protein n=1 Tax=Leptinotarsa decemlineata TaxID=7539 RepID=UPI003D304512
MPRTWKRKTDKGLWTSEDLLRGARLVANGMGIRKAALQCNIPYQIFQRRLKKGNLQYSAQLGRRPRFTIEQEKEMAAHLIKLSNMFYGLSRWQFCHLAYRCAENLKMKHRFNTQKQLAGRDWLEGFLKRNPTISVRKPEATSINRIKGFNKTEVTRFFGNLEAVMTKYKFQKSNIYIIWMRPAKQRFKNRETFQQKRAKKNRFSNWLGTWQKNYRNLRHECCWIICATFLFVSKKTFSTLLAKGGPADAEYQVSFNGWTNDEMFLLWLKHFGKFAKPSQDQPVLLVLDNHSSHSIVGTII